MKRNLKKLVLLFSISILLLCLVGCPNSPSPEFVEKQWTVTFDVNGGTPTIPSKTVTDGFRVSKPTIEITKENFFFSEWQLDGVVYDFTTTVTKDITLKAAWSPAISITFDPNTGAFTGDNAEKSTVVTKFPAKGRITAPTVEKTVTNENWNLIGWSTNKNGDENSLFDLNAGSEADITLYAVWTQKWVVTFDNDGGIGTVISQLVATNGTATKPETNLYLYGHNLVFWSLSKETPVEYDFTTPITENITLYAIWTPRLFAIDSIKNGTLVLNCDSNSPKVYDGIITASYTTDVDSTPIDLPLTYVSTSSCYITYSFTPFAPETSTTYTITAKSGSSTKSKNITVNPPAPVTNLVATVNDSYAKLTWTKPTGYSSFTIECYDGETLVATKSSYTTYVEFYGLTNNNSYTFKVITTGTDKSATITGTPVITKKTTDWLYILYMDGDNNLNDPIYLDLNEAEYGLFLVRNTDGSAKSGYESVNVVALWDGFAGDADTTPQIGKKGSYLYELGRDSSNYTTYTTSTGCVLSSDTKNLSYTGASFLDSTATVSTITSAFSGEVNMGSKDTLVNYLKWVQERYDATNIVLQFSNHGGGPKSAPLTVTLENGNKVTLNSDYGRKAMCWDDASSGDFLKTSDVSAALSEAGYGTANKLGMLLMDVCLGASIEDAYQFKDYAQYMVASPNNIPGMGMDYAKLMKSCTTGATLESVGKQLVADYKSAYTMSTTDWNTLINNYISSAASQKVTITQAQAEYHFQTQLTSLATLSLIDLSQVAVLEDAISAFATALLGTDGSSDFTGMTNSKGDTVEITKSNALMELALLPGAQNSGFFTSGTFTWLFDINWFANVATGMFGATLSDGTPNPNSNTEIYDAATAVVNACKNTVIYAWRDKCYDSYNTHKPYGLMISGMNIAVNGNQIVRGKAPSYYKTDLTFGADSSWSDLLISWFGSSN